MNNRIKQGRYQPQQQPQPPDIESLDIRLIHTLAKLFGESAKNLKTEQVKKARSNENDIKRDRFSEASRLALMDCKLVKIAPRANVSADYKVVNC
ncbi:hypothetical protein SAMN05216516_103269 [Izhakiella capsodis]|uniref:Uncharacterized protein n=1 Tax=Izhakiella capsodis TaxID=1367852 RepID=A0A1I4X4M3_9GAMM|nr:hypothetical protein [Izhakiella capsodis]SFN20356.1 hypothetical protein SAMN05216516_103269 [Izhakiella capsodis]